MGQKLYELLDQLMGGPIQGRRMRRQFHDDPESVTGGLEAEARQALYSMDRPTIGGAVGSELQQEDPQAYAQYFDDWYAWLNAWPFPETEFPANELPAECTGQTGEQPLYPNPRPKVYSITPANKSVTAKTVVVDVVGQGFVKGKTRVQLVNAAGQALAVTNQSFSGTFRCGHLKATVTLPAAAGTYNVQVVVYAGTSTVTGQPVTINVPSAVQFTADP